MQMIMKKKKKHWIAVVINIYAYQLLYREEIKFVDRYFLQE